MGKMIDWSTFACAAMVLWAWVGCRIASKTQWNGVAAELLLIALWPFHVVYHILNEED